MTTTQKRNARRKAARVRARGANPLWGMRIRVHVVEKVYLDVQHCKVSCTPEDHVTDTAIVGGCAYCGEPTKYCWHHGPSIVVTKWKQTWGPFLTSMHEPNSDMQERLQEVQDALQYYQGGDRCFIDLKIDYLDYQGDNTFTLKRSQGWRGKVGEVTETVVADVVAAVLMQGPFQNRAIS